MEKRSPEKIAYYLEKLTQYGSVHLAKKQPRSFTYRKQRLACYKRLMHELFVKEGFMSRKVHN